MLAVYYQVSMVHPSPLLIHFFFLGKRFCSEFIYKGRQLELSEEQITGYHPISSVAVTEKLEMLYQKCINACRNAYTPLSQYAAILSPCHFTIVFYGCSFPVGAAVLTDKVSSL